MDEETADRIQDAAYAAASAAAGVLARKKSGVTVVAPRLVVAALCVAYVTTMHNSTRDMAATRTACLNQLKTALDELARSEPAAENARLN